MSDESALSVSDESAVFQLACGYLVAAARPFGDLPDGRDVPWGDKAEGLAASLALAARELVRATDALPRGQQPTGWADKDTARVEAVRHLTVIYDAHRPHSCGDKALAECGCATARRASEDRQACVCGDPAPCTTRIHARAALDVLGAYTAGEPACP